MFRDIVLKELLDLLLSLRATLTAATIVALMTVSAVLFVDDYRESVEDYRAQVGENLDGLRQSASARQPLFRLLSFRDQRIYRSPSPFSFLAEGGEKDLPNAISVDAFLLHSPQNLSRTNPYLWRFRKLDWTLITMLVLSFAAMVLAFDGISAEREKQMLRLVMSNAVSRHALILGKFTGITLCLMLLFLVGAVVHLLVLSLSGVVEVGVGTMLMASVAVVLSGLYVSVFVWLGLLISSRTRESATSLVVCLLTWALLVVAIPNLGGVIASELADVPAPEEVNAEAWEARKQAKAAYDQQHPDEWSWVSSGNWSPGEPLERAIQMDEARERVHADAWARMLAQARQGRNATRISPAAVYRYGMENLAGSGLEHYARFLEQAKRYRESLRDFLLSKYPGSPDHAFSQDMAMKAGEVAIDYEEIPKFEDRLIGVSEALASAAPDVLLLGLWSVVSFLAAYVAFLRCDIR